MKKNGTFRNFMQFFFINIFSTGKDGKPKDYYNLECLVFLIKNRELQHTLYVKAAGVRKISI